MKGLVNQIKHNRLSKFTLYLIDILKGDNNTEISSDMKTTYIWDENFRDILFCVDDNEIVISDWNIIYICTNKGLISSNEIYPEVEEAIMNSKYSNRKII